MADESRQDFGYSDFSSNNNPPVEGFAPSHELFSLQAGMEMLGLPSKHHVSPTNSEPWISFFPKADSNSSVGEESLMFGPSEAWQQHQTNQMILDDPSLRCLFPVQGSQAAHQQQPSGGLSLSLHNPQDQPYQNFPSEARDGFFFPTTYRVKGSIYLAPAQELLNEFCSLGGATSPKHKTRKVNQLQEGGSSSSSSSLSTMDFLQLQKRKAKLLSMVEEVDRKYKRNREQMREVVSSFEAVAGEGAATVYSTLSSKAVSRHFRSLRDGIVSQIEETKKAMGEKVGPVVPAGITKGETPRLKILDRCIRQQKAFLLGEAAESSPWRPQRGLPERSVSVLRAWLFEHFLHPYPSDVDKHILSRQTGLSRSQVSNWFINARVRLWKPMVEEMYVEETKEQDNQPSKGTGAEYEDGENNRSRQRHQLQSVTNPNPNPNPSASEEDSDQKPPIESDSLSSIISSSTPRSTGRDHRVGQQSWPENYGVMDLDFSSYNRNGGHANNVSLTLGLQQHTGGGISLSFSQPTSQQSVFFSKDQMEDCQPVKFSIMDGEAQNLPYRNLMGAQLLHDLAG